MSSKRACIGKGVTPYSDKIEYEFVKGQTALYLNLFKKGACVNRIIFKKGLVNLDGSSKSQGLVGVYGEEIYGQSILIGKEKAKLFIDKEVYDLVMSGELKSLSLKLLYEKESVYLIALSNYVKYKDSISLTKEFC